MDVQAKFWSIIWFLRKKEKKFRKDKKSFLLNYIKKLHTHTHTHTHTRAREREGNMENCHPEKTDVNHSKPRLTSIF